MRPLDRDHRAVTAGIVAWQPPRPAAALDALALAVLVVDRQGHILHANRERRTSSTGPTAAVGPARGLRLPSPRIMAPRSWRKDQAQDQRIRHLGTRRAEGRSRLQALIQAACDGPPGRRSASSSSRAVFRTSRASRSASRPSPRRRRRAGRWWWPACCGRKGGIRGAVAHPVRPDPAEAQVGAGLARGGTWGDRRRTRISVTTARTCHVASHLQDRHPAAEPARRPGGGGATAGGLWRRVAAVPAQASGRAGRRRRRRETGPRHTRSSGRPGHRNGA